MYPFHHIFYGQLHWELSNIWAETIESLRITNKFLEKKRAWLLSIFILIFKGGGGTTVKLVHTYQASLAVENCSTRRSLAEKCETAR